MLKQLTALTVANYAAGFDGYDGHEFKIAATRPPKKTRVLVRAKLTDANGNMVSLDYLLHQRDEAWRIINVIAEGVSDLSLKRADYAAVLKNEGFEQLMTRIEAPVDALSGDG